MGSDLTPSPELSPTSVTICLDKLTNLEVLVGIPISKEQRLVVNGIFDTGAQVSLVSEKLLNEHIPQLLMEIKPCKVTVTGPAGKPIPILGILTILLGWW